MAWSAASVSTSGTGAWPACAGQGSSSISPNRSIDAAVARTSARPRTDGGMSVRSSACPFLPGHPSSSSGTEAPTGSDGGSRVWI
ncbi:MAG: hypothetical protein QOE30_2147 [Mycobacterium sp.]|jgi:hypothetical protein|nr:hypothetical protein [Mycobacterium sp.]